MTMPTPSTNPGAKTRTQLITILGLLVLIILLLALFLFLQISRDRNSGAGVAEGSVSSSSENNAVVGDDNGAGGSAGDDGGPNPTAGQPASGSSETSSSRSSASSSSDSSATTSGANSLTGTVKVFQTRAEVLAYEQRQEPNPGAQDKGPYAVLILDQPTKVTAKLSGQGGADTRVIEKAVVNPALHNDGEHTTITFADDEYYWPSDPGVPSGIVLESAPRN